MSDSNFTLEEVIEEKSEEKLIKEGEVEEDVFSDDDEFQDYDSEQEAKEQPPHVIDVTIFSY